MSLEIVTANHLRDGRAVYLGESGWSENLQAAQVAGSAAAAKALLAAAEAAAAANAVVAPYLIEVADEGGRLVPQRLRERIRERGPTVAAGARPPVREVA